MGGTDCTPLPSPGIYLGTVQGRRGTGMATEGAPVGLWVRPMASRLRLFTLYNFHSGSFRGVTEKYRAQSQNSFQQHRAA